MTRAEYIAAMTMPDPEFYPDDPVPLELAEFIADQALRLGLVTDEVLTSLTLQA